MLNSNIILEYNPQHAEAVTMVTPKQNVLLKQNFVEIKKVNEKAKWRLIWPKFGEFRRSEMAKMFCRNCTKNAGRNETK